MKLFRSEEKLYNYAGRDKPEQADTTYSELAD